MIVTGSVTKVERVDVVVDPKDIINQLKSKWLNEIIPEAGRYDMVYINRSGFWEGWVDTHGSGITDRLKEATPEEKDHMQAFELMLALAK